MAEVKTARPITENEEIVGRAKDFWTKNGKTLGIALGALIVLIGGFFLYQKLVSEPKEKKAADAVFKAQEYYATDSLDKALNGDGQFVGFEKVISQYGGTKPGKLARFYAGSIYLKKGAFDKAINYLKDFSTDAPQIEARAQKLLGDAYAESGKVKDAVDSYKKAAAAFEEDDNAASEALFLAAYLSDKVLNDKQAAINLYKEVKSKYSQTQWGYEAEKYLAAAGVYDSE